MKQIASTEWQLESTGRVLYMSFDTIGIDMDDDEGYFGETLSYGYDGNHSAIDFTPEERAEIADHAIAQWTAWKNANVVVESST